MSDLSYFDKIYSEENKNEINKIKADIIKQFKESKCTCIPETDGEIQYADIYEMFDDIISWLEKFHLGDDCYFVVNKTGAVLYWRGGLTVLPKDYRENMVNNCKSFEIEYKKDESKTDNVNHPDHYNQGKYECIDEMITLFGIEAVKSFCKCNVFKYRYRAERKNGAEDIAKADWYMNKLMELENNPSSEEKVDFKTTTTYFK